MNSTASATLMKQNHVFHFLSVIFLTDKSQRAVQ